MREHDVSFVSSLITPDFDQGKVVRFAVLLEDFDAHRARIFTAIGAECPQEAQGSVREIGLGIDVRDHVQLRVLTVGNDTQGTEQDSAEGESHGS